MAAPSWLTGQVTQQMTLKKELMNTRQYLIKKAQNLFVTVMDGQGVTSNAAEEADLDGLPDPCLS